MDSRWNYDAPSSSDFNYDDKENLGSYFDVEHEYADVKIKTEIFSPECSTPNVLQNAVTHNGQPRRRSKSTGRIFMTPVQALSKIMSDIDLSKIQIATSTQLDMNNATIPEKSSRFPRRTLSKDSVASNDAATRRQRFGRQEQKNITKYVSMAEAINRFHRETPSRFRTVSSRADAKKVLQEIASHPMHRPPTIPVTPKLTTITRSRPVNVVDREEQEYAEFQRLQLEAKQTIANYKMEKRLTVHTGILAQPRARPTHIQPFSFDARDRQLPKRRQALVSKVVQEEKKAREFQAKPLPVFKTPPKVPSSSSGVIPETPNFASKEIMVQRKEKFAKMVEEKLQEEQRAKEFKAQPAVVLQKVPFVPEKVSKLPTVSEGFQLSTEIRSKQRENFDNLMKQKEKERLEAITQAEIIKLKHEEEEILQIRKATTHKAQPIKHYKPIQPVKVMKEVTIPQTPNLLRRIKAKLPPQ